MADAKTIFHFGHDRWKVENEGFKEWRKNTMNNLRFLNLISMLLSVPCLTVPLSKAFAGSSIP